MRRTVAGYLVVAALTLGAMAGMAPSRAEAAASTPLSVVYEPGSLVQTVQYYGRPGYYGRPRFYGPGPRYNGRRGFYGGPRYRPAPRFYGRGRGYYARRGYYR